MNAKKPITLLIAIFFISPLISAQSFEDFFEGVLDAFAESPLYQKYADSAVNYSSLVERQGIKYQVNSSTPFSGNYIMYVDDNPFCIEEAGSYRNCLLYTSDAADES